MVCQSSNSIRGRLVWWLVFLALALNAQAAVAAEQESNSLHRFVLEVEIDALRAQWDGDPSTEEIVQRSFEVVKLRFQDLDIEPSSVTRKGETQIVVDLVGADSRSTIESVFQIGKDVQFLLVVATVDPAKSPEGELTEGKKVLPMADNSASLLVSQSGAIPGDHLTYANPGVDPWTDENVIVIGFDKIGRRLLAELSTNHVGGRMAVVVEGEVVIAPVLEEPILGGHLQLAEDFTAERANEIAIMLRAGAIPSPFRIVEERILE